MRLLPSTASQGIWAVHQDACLQPNAARDCAQRRGGTFAPNKSTSWARHGTYSLPLAVESALNLSGRAVFGLDTVALSPPDARAQASSSLSYAQQQQLLSPLPEQVVGGLGQHNGIHIGILGVSPRLVNFSDFNDARPSLLGSLRAARRIPSASWAYTAGSAHYSQQANQPPAFGSLVLGGYDAARFVPNNVSFRFGPSTARDLLVGVQAITLNTGDGAAKTASLLPPPSNGGVYALVNSLVPHMWLPQQTCTEMATALSLTRDNRTDYYYIDDDDAHASLLKKRANITFRLAPSLDTSSSNSRGAYVDIVVPYASLALNVTPPLVRTQRRYFPLRRAADQDQYTLGRAFLQHAYVIADYDNARFSVSQAVLLPPNATQRLVAIHPPPTIDGTSSRSSSSSAAASKLGAGVIGGIAAALVVAIGICVAAFIFTRRQRRKRRSSSGSSSGVGGDRRHSICTAVTDATSTQVYPTPKLDSGAWSTKHQPTATVQEVELCAEISECDAGMLDRAVSPPPMQQLDGRETPAFSGVGANISSVHELPAGDFLPPELAGDDTEPDVRAERKSMYEE